MPMTGCISPVSVVAALVALALAPMARLYAEPSANAPVKIGASDIGGTVSSSIGPEAGVWVIAETTELPTKFAKIVVTDDRGRYVMPSLPKANYDVWVRGYGLVDSAKVRANPGNIVNLKAAIAPTPCRSGAILSGDLLVFHAQDSRHERISGHRLERQRNACELKEPRAVARYR